MEMSESAASFHRLARTHAGDRSTHRPTRLQTYICTQIRTPGVERVDEGAVNHLLVQDLVEVPCRGREREAEDEAACVNINVCV